MKSAINYYYNLFPDHIFEQDNFFYFWIEDNKYYFVPFKNKSAEVVKIYQTLLKYNMKTNIIIFNKEKELITIYKNMEYVLFKVNCLETEMVDLYSFLNFTVNEKPVDWGRVWSDKIDYFSYQVSQRALYKDIILNSFSYYVGLGENAIQYYNLIDKTGASVSIQHKRIFAENYEINYYNPLNMLYDYSIRDLAEYIKFSFFQDKMDSAEIINYINKMKLNSTMLNLLFARMLFPTYYFDHYERLVNDEEDEGKLINIINKASSYEKFLKNFYDFYGSLYNLIKIEWLISS